MKTAAFPKIIRLLCAAVMLLSILPACGSNPAKPTKEDPEIREEPAMWAEQVNARKTETVDESMHPDPFDEKLLEFLSHNVSGNYMASPLSFRYALGLLLAGAEGETKAELLNAERTVPQPSDFRLT